MKKKNLLRILAGCLLALVLIPGGAAFADDNADDDSGMEISKTSTDNNDGTYTIELEAYATGEKVTTEIKKDIPTDIVLVLDQSGSMANDFSTSNYTFSAYTGYFNTRNNDFYNLRHNGGSGNLWYQLGDGSYVSVSVERTVSSSVSYIYTYSYTDASNITQIIGTSIGQNTNFTNPTLYQRSTETITRLQALKNALEIFVDQVNEKAKGKDGSFGTADDVDHRIAVVGFASGATYNGTNYNYGNTEILIGSNEYRYGTAAQGVYGKAFQDMKTSGGRTNVNASVNALTANGGTLTNLGMEMANGILNANPVGSGEERNRVVVVFTDGVPGWSGYDSNTANAAITEANTTKNTHGATVYTVGIFDGADATSSGNTNGTDDQKANWFMQNLSSNNGTVQNPSYYLSAGDADALTNIFKQIADQIEQGGAAIELDESAIIRDIIAPSFTLPPGSSANDIILESYECTGVGGSGEYIWSKNPTALGATAVIGSTDPGTGTTTNNQIDVTGYDFSANWVGTETAVDGTVTYRGNKLVIKIVVQPREGLLGGNQVFTNTSAGVYENADAANPLFVFDKPTVDVPLAPIVINIPDNISGSYYGQTVPEDALKLQAEVTIGGNNIDFDAPNYGLEPWQNEYVDIEAIASAVGGSFEDVREDLAYTLTVNVSPKLEGTIGSEGASATGTSTILVFKPKLTYKDSDVYYGDIASFGGGNFVSKTWVNTSTGTEIDHTNIDMLNAEPVLGLSYTPESGTIVDGKVATKQDIKVKVDVSIPVGIDQTSMDITDLTTFVHQPCSPACGWTDPTSPGNPAFLLHVKTCALTITKTGGNDAEPYVFDIYKDGVKYTEASILGNGSVTVYELPVGSYTIQENAEWSWRFNPDNGQAAALSSSSNTGTVVCANTQNDKIYWLNGYSEIVKNTFGIAN